MIFHRRCDAEEGHCLHLKIRRGQGNQISPANNLRGSRAGRKVGYTPCDDQPGSNPFDLRIVVGSWRCHSRIGTILRRCKRCLGMCLPNPAFAGGSESAIIIIEKTRLLECGFWRSCGYRRVFVLGLHDQRSVNFCAPARGG